MKKKGKYKKERGKKNQKCGEGTRCFLKWNPETLTVQRGGGKKKNREDIVNKAIVAALTPLLFGTIEIQSQIRRTHAGRQK